MLPTDEERAKIQEAQMNNPELPLGSAEQFLLTLASITELGARLKLWLFKSDYENMEKVINTTAPHGNSEQLLTATFSVRRKWLNR